MNTKSKYIELLIHVVAISIMFVSLCFFAEKTGSHYEINWEMFHRHGVAVLLFAALFYLNYYVLIPKLYFSKKKTLYIVVNFLIIIVFVWFMQQFAAPEHHGALSPFGEDDMDGMPFLYRWRERQPLLPRPLWFFCRDMLLLLLSVALSLTIRMISYARKMEVRNTELESAKFEAELLNLRTQLNPHFLLNTLNNIYALIAFDTSKAQAAVLELSKLLRHVLYENQATFVPLVNEVEFLEHYIRLMKMRLTDDVVVVTNFDVKPEHDTQIAPQIFISLIENAFKHGIAPNKPSVISIALSDDADGFVTCVITNDNHPKSEADKSGSGIGLEQVRRRLDLLYPKRYSWTTMLSDDQKIYTSRLTINTKL